MMLKEGEYSGLPEGCLNVEEEWKSQRRICEDRSKVVRVP